jgi:hypothetical protein
MNPDPSEDLEALIQELTATKYPGGLSEFDVAQYLAGMDSPEDEAHFKSVMASNEAFRLEMIARQKEDEAFFTPERLEAYEKAIFAALKLPQPGSEEVPTGTEETSVQKEDLKIAARTWPSEKQALPEGKRRDYAAETPAQESIKISHLLQGFTIRAQADEDNPDTVTRIVLTRDCDCDKEPPRSVIAVWPQGRSQPGAFEVFKRESSPPIWIAEIKLDQPWSEMKRVIQNRELQLQQIGS